MAAAMEAQGMESFSESEMLEIGLGATETTGRAEIEAEVEAETEAEAAAETEGSAEAVAAEALEGMEAGEAGGQEFFPIVAALASAVLPQLTKTVFRYVRATVKRIAKRRGSTVVKKLQRAVKGGPNKVSQILRPAVLRALPKPFRPVASRLIAPVTRAGFKWIARNTGLSRTEIEAAEAEAEYGLEG